MVITWGGIKDWFFLIGSLAGAVAFIRPWIERKAAKDQQRIDHVKSLINEQQLVDLEASVYQFRSVDAEQFEPFSRLTYERRTNQDSVRFSGPFAARLGAQLDSLLASYKRLRDYIQVPEWEPKNHIRGDDEKITVWDFNKQAFQKESGGLKDYARHLDEAAQQAVEMKEAFQRFQIVAETDLLELPFARWLIPMRFKKHGVSLSS
ncbi:hypothetical protein [Rhodanobacter soli]